MGKTAKKDKYDFSVFDNYECDGQYAFDMIDGNIVIKEETTNNTEVDTDKCKLSTLV